LFDHSRASIYLKWAYPFCICLFVLSGCAVRVTPTPEPVTVTFTYATFDVDREPYEAFIEAFSERYPHITVEVRQWAPWVGVDAEDVDVLAVNGGLVSELREEESIVSLDPFIQRDERFDLSDLHADSVAYFTYEGERWAIPAGMTANVIYYNKDLFDQYGVPYPEFGWTWDDFLEKVVALRDPDAGIYGYAAGDRGFDTIPFIYQHGGRIVDDLHNPTRVVFDDPLTVEALEWYARLVHEYDAVLTPEQSRREFSVEDPLLAIVLGKVGMWMEGLSGTREVKTTLNWGIAPLPRDAQSFTLSSIYGYAISAHAADPDACWQWITFLSEQVHPGLIPARTSLLESTTYEERVGAEVVDVALESLESAEIISYWRLFSEFPREMQAFGHAVERILRGDVTVQEAMEQAQQAAD
jgi:multiple sugar transport system substrate-binding protein